jgi:allophanate hydrolase subunit 2
VTGGYPVIGVVDACALPLAAQLAPGDQVVFELVDGAEGDVGSARAGEVTLD